MKRLEKRKYNINRDMLLIKKLVTSVIFLIFLFGFSFQNLKVSYQPVAELLKTKDLNYSNVGKKIKSIENEINDNVYGKDNFISYYGYLQKLMDKNEEGNFDVVKDKDGVLHYTFFAEKPNPVDEIASRVKAFKDGLTDKNKKLIYLMTPDKYIKGSTKFEMGMPYNYANETADNFIAKLDELGIDTIDFRQNLKDSNIPYNKLFFRTDHHWKPETVFWEFGQLVNILNKKYSMGLDKEGFYTNKENYNFITYENSYIGSMGRNAGIFYDGADDFTLIYPKFKTSYSYYAKTGEKERKLGGRFEESLISAVPFRKNYNIYDLEADKYFSYLYGNDGFVHVHNKNNENGLKLLFIKDSLVVPLAAFLSTICSDVYLIDPRYYKDNIPKAANDIDVDFIFMSFYPQNLTEEYFPFYEER